MPGRRSTVLPWVLCALAAAFMVGTMVLGASVAGGLSGGGGARIVLDPADDPDGVFLEVPVEGVIVDAAVDGPNPVRWVERCLSRAKQEPDLRGILLRVNSPGGGIRASAVILKALQDFRAEVKVPLVVYMKDVAASGGYYVSMAADHIVAHPDTITASIGVIWNTMNARGLLEEKLGVRMGNLKSAPMKDIGSPYREMTEGERALVQGIVDEAFAEFVRVVVAGRNGKGAVPVTETSVRGLESSILSGRRAFEVGLVDELGYREQAIAKLRALAGVSRPEVVEYAKPRSLLDTLLGARIEAEPPERHLLRLMHLYTEGPALLALWER